MKRSIVWSLALLTGFSIFPAEGRSAVQENEACSKISEMLFDTQVRQHEFNPIDYVVIDKTLKETFRLNCESVKGDSSRFSNGQPMQRNGVWLLPTGQEFQQALYADAASDAPILQPFLSAHRSCAAGCGYVSWGIWGDEAHQQRRSCHNSGQAIDIHAITCGGTHAAGSSRFNEYVSCMRGSLGVIYGSGDHKNHAHFQLHNCDMCQGRNCGGGRVPSQPNPGRGNDGNDDGDNGDNSDDGDNGDNGDNGDED